MNPELDTPQAPGTATLEILSRSECLRLLSTVPLGRLGISIDALPAILPVNFVLVRDRIIIRTAPGTKLDAAVSQRIVAFEADEHDPEGAWGWSVLVRGRGSEIVDRAALEEACAQPLRPWAVPGGTANRFLSIQTTLVSGRRFGTR